MLNDTRVVESYLGGDEATVRRSGGVDVRRFFAALAIVMFAACGDSAKVGDESLLSFEDQAQQRLDQSTPKTQDDSKVAIAVSINADTSGAGSFDPSVARVFTGSTVRWVNKDTVARSVESDTGTFSSGSIKPGDSWSFQFKRAGKFNYHDGTRPYAVAAIEVRSR